MDYSSSLCVCSWASWWYTSIGIVLLYVLRPPPKLLYLADDQSFSLARRSWVLSWFESCCMGGQRPLTSRRQQFLRRSRLRWRRRGQQLWCNTRQPCRWSQWPTALFKKWRVQRTRISTSEWAVLIVSFCWWTSFFLHLTQFPTKIIIIHWWYTKGGIKGTAALYYTCFSKTKFYLVIILKFFKTLAQVLSSKEYINF